jgi:hypothetical protein
MPKVVSIVTLVSVERKQALVESEKIVKKIGENRNPRLLCKMYF